MLREYYYANMLGQSIENALENAMMRFVTESLYKDLPWWEF